MPSRSRESTGPGRETGRRTRVGQPYSWMRRPAPRWTGRPRSNGGLKMSAVSESERLAEAVHEAARLAADTALDRWAHRFGPVDTKGDGSPVTEGDRAAECAVREWLERHFPDDGVLGEEFGLTRPNAPRRWTVDPIDGTRSYV